MRRSARVGVGVDTAAITRLLVDEAERCELHAGFESIRGVLVNPLTHWHMEDESGRSREQRSSYTELLEKVNAALAREENA